MVLIALLILLLAVSRTLDPGVALPIDAFRDQHLAGMQWDVPLVPGTTSVLSERALAPTMHRGGCCLLVCTGSFS